MAGTADLEPDGDDSGSSRDFVSSFSRGLEVIRAFSRARPSMTLSEIAAETNMTRAAARRFLLTLVREGYAETDGKHFRLSAKILELGFSVLASMNILEVLQPAMDDLAKEMNESCFAAVLDGFSVIYIARASSLRFFDVDIHIGSRVPAHCVSTGRVLLAALPPEELEKHLAVAKLEAFTETTVTNKAKLRKAIADVRKQGWSLVDQELEIGLRSISAPIKAPNGRTVCALNMCCPTPRISLDDVHGRFIPKLVQTAERISFALMS
ncbi:IclR family transcriptional regulator domain-containing protein [Acuticoccus kandeliae]|uniref:IclR family transcriptional regulator domain-containing protein n=1 Tax=Acuticoccus kandeliae TaxID=2073160 RepID=UPI000D3E11FE|nr:IclR family transcriptional regulator C-terminal domain-containing protein [Acuticoccus kandeliae]